MILALISLVDINNTRDLIKTVYGFDKIYDSIDYIERNCICNLRPLLSRTLLSHSKLID
jgi:hypothetical protein